MVNFEVVLGTNFNSQDHHKVLGCHPSASRAEITKAYRDLSRMFHPKNRPNDEAAARIFVRIGQAYAALVGPEDEECGRESQDLTATEAEWIYESRFGPFRKLYYDEASIVGLPYANALKENIKVQQNPQGTSDHQLWGRFEVGVLRTWYFKTKIDCTLSILESVLTWGTIATCECFRLDKSRFRSNF